MALRSKPARQSDHLAHSGTQRSASAPKADKRALLATRIIDLAAQTKPDFFELAEALAAAKKQYPAEYDEILRRAGIGRRHAYYLLEVRECFSPFRRSHRRLRAIGWTKLKILAQSINAENFDERIAMAESASAQKLALMLKGQAPVPSSRCVLLYFTPIQYQIFEEAILSNGGKRSGKRLMGQEDALLKALA